jgi:hypothetical protein
MMSPPLLVWIVRPDCMFEREWIYTLLKYAKFNQINEVYEHEMSRVHTHAIIIFNHSVKYTEYFQKYQDNNIPFVAIHLSDETLGDDVTFYKFPCCLRVFRNYYHPVHSRLPNVVTFGLGFKTGFGGLQVEAEHPRFYNWCFAGNLHSQSRLDELRPFFKLLPNKYHFTTDGFNSKKGLSMKDYKILLQSSRFALCPVGQSNIDSFRVYEALEAGCIPVVRHTTEYQVNYWTGIFPWCDMSEIPFVTAVDTFSLLNQVINVMDDASVYFAIVKKVKLFWTDAKLRWGNALRDAILTLCNT